MSPAEWIRELGGNIVLIIIALGLFGEGIATIVRSFRKEKPQPPAAGEERGE